MNYQTALRIGTRDISLESPTYFIADLAANHDGDLGRAKDLIWRAKEAGADCAKFQHFLAERIVSKVGFEGSAGQVSHQAKWKKSVVEVYDQYHTRRDWTEELLDTCRKAEIDFMTTPYDAEAIDMFREIVPAYKIGSGDITHHAAIAQMARTGKPILLACGAATMQEVEAAVGLILQYNATPTTPAIPRTSNMSTCASCRPLLPAGRAWCWVFPIIRPAIRRCWVP